MASKKSIKSRSKAKWVSGLSKAKFEASRNRPTAGCWWERRRGPAGMAEKAEAKRQHK